MKHSTRWLTTAGAVAAASALVLTGCTASGDSEPTADSANGDLTPVTLQLQWVAQAQFAGYYAAVDQGYYRDAGLDVEILEGAVDVVLGNDASGEREHP